MSDEDRLIRLRADALERGIPVARPKTFALLRETVFAVQPKRILEIGTAVGCSAVGMLLSAVNARLTGIELREDYCEETRRNLCSFGVSSRALIHCGDASVILPMLTAEYDFIFLDGPKGHYYEYLPILKELLSSGGILFADNVRFLGYITGEREVPHRHKTIWNSMTRFIRTLTEDGQMETAVREIEDGVLIARKK